MSRTVLMGVSLAVAMAAPCWAEAEPPAPVTVQDNMNVEFDYTLTVDGAVVESTEGKQPMRYAHGKQQIVPGLERQLVGLRVGETKEIAVSPEEGYGQFDPAALIEVDKAQLPADVSPAAGMVLRGANSEGQLFRATIKEVKDAIVILDLNHPLAGKTLAFKVTITSVTSAATP